MPIAPITIHADMFTIWASMMCVTLVLLVLSFGFVCVHSVNRPAGRKITAVCKIGCALCLLSTVAVFVAAVLLSCGERGLMPFRASILSALAAASLVYLSPFAYKWAYHHKQIH
jgi:hypothetical protein